MVHEMNKQLLMRAAWPDGAPNITDEALERALGELDPREKIVIELRYSTNPVTQREAGKLVPWANGLNFGVSGSMVHIIELRALRHLRRLCKQ